MVVTENETNGAVSKTFNGCDVSLDKDLLFIFYFWIKRERVKGIAG